MKNRLIMLKLLLVLSATFATTAVFGQATFVWTNQSPANSTIPGDLATAANWDPNGVPNPTANDGVTFGDEIVWDGRTTGPLSLTANSGQVGGSGSPWGLRVRLTSNQVDPVTLRSPVPISGGTRIQNFIIESGAGAFNLGDNSPNALDMIMGGVANQIHDFINNSANTATIHPSARWRHGGGNVHTYLFSGTGDWVVNDYLRTANNSPVQVTKSGPGTFTWTGVAHPGDGIDSVTATPFTVEGGTAILKSVDLITGQAIVNDALLVYDAATGAGGFSGVMSGTGTLRVSAGTLTLSSGASTFTGNFNLTGGRLIVGGVENVDLNTGPLGFDGTISFAGGTLGFSANNTFDYSPRFDTAAGQAYSFDTGGQNVTFTNALGSSSATLTKVGPGTLTLAGPGTYSGLTTVSAGRLVFQGTKTGAGNITVADGAGLGVTTTGTPVTPGTLTVGTSTLEFNNVNSPTTAPLAADTLASSGTITFNVNSGTFAVGQSYPLLTWINGSAPAVNLGVVIGAVGNLSTNGNTIQLNVTELALIWSGANNGTWDASTPNNWQLAGVPAVYANPLHVAFDDTASGATDVTISGVVQPSSVSFNNNAKPYSVASSPGNNLAGSGPLIKAGPGTATISGGANANTGAATLIGGSLSVGALANGGSASDLGAAGSGAANLVLNGGRLQYTGGAAGIDRLFTVGPGGGAIDASGSGALNLNNAGAVGLSGPGARVFTLTGANAEDNTLAAALGDSGGPTTLAKGGAGKWVLSGNNTHSGGTTISAGGILQVGAGGANGALGSGTIANNGTLIFNRTGTLTVDGVVSGTGSVANDGLGTVILAADNTYSGGTTINAGTLQVGDGGPTGKLNIGSPIVNNGTFIFDSTGVFTLSGGGVISGSGNVIVRGSGGALEAIGANTYSGWTLIEPGATFQPARGNAGALVSSVVTNNGTLRLVRQDTGVFIYSGNIVGTGALVKDNNNFNFGDVTLLGTNTYSGGTTIAGGAIVLGDGFTEGAGSIIGDVVFTNSNIDDSPARTLTFNRPDNYTFSGNIIGATVPGPNVGNVGSVEHRGSGILTLTGNNTYGGGTTINAGALVVGNGGTSGSLGTGPITDNNLLAFDRSDSLTIDAVISGGGSVEQRGTGVLMLNATNTYSGLTTVSNGTLIINGENFAGLTTVYGGTLGGTGVFSGLVILEAGTTLAPGASIGTLTFNGGLTLRGDVAIEVNKSHPQTNDIVNSPFTSNEGTGTLTVANLGPALAADDKFTLFTQPVQNGAALTVTGGGATWINRLAEDGSIIVDEVLVVTPPTLNFTKAGNNLEFSWTGSFKLQAQTNDLDVGISGNWGDYPGGTSGVTVPIDTIKGTVFFRLAPAP